MRARFVFIVALAAVALGACGTRVDRAAYQAALAPGEPAVVTPSVAGAPAQHGGGRTIVVRGAHTPPAATSTKAPATGGGAPAPDLHLSTAQVGKEIVIGLHVPETGAAPLPTNWTDSLDVVQAYGRDHPIFGRTIRFAVEDDGYDPARGLAACRKLAGENVLFVIGHSMPTIEDECAGFLGPRGIPYLMRGVPESYLRNRPLAYFGTASDDVQAKLLADYSLRRLGATTKPVAVVTENDQPVSRDVFTREIKAGGGTIVAVENSVPRQPDFGAIISKLQGAGAQIVFLNIAPVDAIKIAVQSQSSGFHPTWIGEGTHWNYNLAMESAGMALDGAVVFSPWSSIDSAAASSYKQAFATYKPNATPDDIGEIIWGWSMLVRAALQNAGAQLSRSTFVGALNSLRFDQPYWQPVAYTATDHTGAREVAVFRGDGRAKHWVQISGFAGSF